MGPRGRPPSVVTWFVNLYAATLWQLYYIIIHIYIYTINQLTYDCIANPTEIQISLGGFSIRPGIPWGRYEGDDLKPSWIHQTWSCWGILTGRFEKIAMWIKTSPLSFHGPWKIICTLWLFNIAMENSPFVDDFPITTSIYKGFSMAMLNNQVVNEDVLLPWLPGKHNKIQWFFQTAYLSCQL